jgi:hypothetical protein
VANLAARQVRRERLSPGLALLFARSLRGPERLDLGGHRRQVGVERLFEQAPLLRRIGLASGRELEGIRLAVPS